ncbi:MAG TPA: hypothetical protein VIR32_00560 [Lachnospiraceae bacterium]
MEIMAEFKDKIQEVYAKSGAYLIPIIKFALALFTFSQINSGLGQFSLLNNLFIVLVLSLLCAIMPWSMIAVFSGIFVLLHSILVGYEAGAFVFVSFLLMGILALRFCGKKMILLVLVPLAFKANMPLLVPLVAGLTAGSSAALAVACGSFVYGLFSFIAFNAEALKFTSAADIPMKMQLLMKGTLQNPELMLSIVVTALVVLIVYHLRKFSMDYSWDLAIILGGASYIVLTMLGATVLGVNLSLVAVLAGSIGSVIIAYFVKIFLFHVDYKQVNHLQFEDDDYYYYVKAIPKIKGKGKNVKKEKKSSSLEEKKGKDKEELSDTQDFSKAIETEDYQIEQNFEEVDFESKLEKSLNDF